MNKYKVRVGDKQYVVPAKSAMHAQEHVKKMLDGMCCDATIMKSGEHELFNGKSYGYVNVEHPSLGDFYISVSADKKDVRTDGEPWNFIKSKGYTNAQRAWIEAHKRDILRAMPRGTVSDSVNDAAAEDLLQRAIAESKRDNFKEAVRLVQSYINILKSQHLLDSVKDEASERKTIEALITDEEAAMEAYTVAIANLKDKIPDESIEVLKAIRTDEETHLENLYAILSGNVTEKNLHDSTSVGDDKEIGYANGFRIFVTEDKLIHLHSFSKANIFKASELDEFIRALQKAKQYL